MRANLDPQGTFSSGCMTLLYETALTDTATSITISNLVGNTTNNFMLFIYIKNAYNGACTYYLRPNNDGTGANYNSKQYWAYPASSTAYWTGAEPGLHIGYATAINQLSASVLKMCTASGIVRISNTLCGESIVGSSTAPAIVYNTGEYESTASEITSLVICGDYNSCFASGSYFKLFGEVPKA